MGWADGHIARLVRGETVQFRPRGNSMVGIGNNRGGINGWITRRQIFGYLLAVE